MWELAKESSCKVTFAGVSVVSACLHAKWPRSCPVLCDSMGCSLQGSFVHGVPSQEYWSGLPSPPRGDLPDQGSDLHL